MNKRNRIDRWFAPDPRCKKEKKHVSHIDSPERGDRVFDALKRLNQYLSLKKEEKMWEQELEELRRKSAIPVKDTVRGSSDKFPYTEHTVTVSGIEKQQKEKWERMEARLRQRQERIRCEREAIEMFIDSLQDSQLRQIVYYRYIKGYGWVKIAQLMSNKESALQMKLKRFF